MELSAEALKGFSSGALSQSQLFRELFSAEALFECFECRFSKSESKGVDRLAGPQYESRAPSEFVRVAAKCNARTFRFSPYLENLKPKGRSKPPRVIGVPTIRDRVVLAQLNAFLGAVFPECVPRNIASSYVRQISLELVEQDPVKTWVCGTDIKTFYDSINRERLMKVLLRRVVCPEVALLIGRALASPIVPAGSGRNKSSENREEKGVPQGLAISNILAAIYMNEVDSAMRKLGIAYFRYVDDVLMYGPQFQVASAYKSLKARLERRGLGLHPMGSAKTTFDVLAKPFSYLGYVFRFPSITVRDSTVERFLQGISAKFAEYRHQKKNKIDRYAYLDEGRLKEIFLLELNEKITGAISESRRYGWIAYFNQINDLTLLSKMDITISGMFERMPDFNHAAPPGLKKLLRSYHEMKHRPRDGYVHNYDVINTRAHKLKFLVQRGRVGPDDVLSDDQINARYEAYRSRVLRNMQSDESVVY